MPALKQQLCRTTEAFSERYPRAGTALWLLSLQYFITQAVTAQAWTQPLSLARNTISDLGNTACGDYGGRLVCSPWAPWMNLSFVVQGVTMALGAALFYQQCRKSPGSRLGFGCLFAAGIGTVMVGLFPENTLAGLHILGAALPFVAGNVGLVALSRSLKLPPLLRFYTLGSGLLALTALVFLLSGNYLGLGLGGMERLVAYPQTLWLIIFGIHAARKDSRRLLA